MKAWHRRLRGAALLLAATLALTACGGGDDDDDDHQDFQVTALVVDSPSGNPYTAMQTDARLVNPWGIAFNPQGFVWVANAETGSSTLYDGRGIPQSLVVSPAADTADVPFVEREPGAAVDRVRALQRGAHRVGTAAVNS